MIMPTNKTMAIFGPSGYGASPGHPDCAGAFRAGQCAASVFRPDGALWRVGALSTALGFAALAALLALAPSSTAERA